MSTIDPGPESDLRRRIAEREDMGFDASAEKRALRRLLSEARACCGAGLYDGKALAYDRRIEREELKAWNDAVEAWRGRTGFNWPTDYRIALRGWPYAPPQDVAHGR